jgi:hypothetical protein
MTVDRPVTKVPIANIERTYRATTFLRQLCVPNEPTVSPSCWNHYAFNGPRLASQVAGNSFQMPSNDTQNKISPL